MRREVVVELERLSILQLTATSRKETFMADPHAAHQHSDPDWLVASPSVGASDNSMPSDLADAETTEERIERLRSLHREEWARIEELGPSDEAMTELRVPPPPELFDEDWHKP